MNDPEQNPNVSLEDLLAMEEAPAFAPENVNLRTGIGGNVAEEPERTVGENPNATRWIFNPFEVIDLRNKPASCGMLYLQNVIFNKVKSLRINVGKAYDVTNNSPLDAKHNPENYDRYDRTAYMIGRELEEQYGDKGVVIVEKMTGQDDETVENLNTLLFGSEVECAADMGNPDHPCPNLPNLLEVLQENVQANVKGLDAGTRAVVLAVATQIRASIETAMRNARTRIDEAQKRILDDKNPNRTLSIAEQRCYLALGEEIPNVMPFTTRKAAGMFAPQGQSVSPGEIANAVTAGVVAAMAAGAGQAPAPAKTVAIPKAEFVSSVTDAAKCAATNSRGEPCKNKAVEGEFCKSHAA